MGQFQDMMGGIVLHTGDPQGRGGWINTTWG